MKEWLIYCHKNKLNGKKYIGQTNDLKRRIGKEGYGYLTKNNKGEYHQPAFAAAIEKYGWENFETSILKEHLTSEEANYYEKCYIEEHKTTQPEFGYNIRQGGSNSSLSEETKEKIRESKKHLSEEARENISNGQKRQIGSMEKRRKLSEKMSGENHPMYGKYHTEETKEKIRQYNLENGNFVKNNPRARKVLCLDTREIFNSCKEAQQKFLPESKNGQLVADACRTGRKSKKLKGLRFKYLDKYKFNYKTQNWKK